MLDVFDPDRTYATTPGAHVLEITELATVGKVKEYIDEIFSAEENLSFTASCANGCTTGNFFIGSKCPKCGTVVESRFASTIQFRNWIEIPEFAPPILNPAVYQVLAPAFGKVKVSRKDKGTPVLDLIMDPDAVLPGYLIGKIPQGMIAFHENFDQIINVLFDSHPLNRGQMQQFRNDLKMFLEKFRDRLFIRYLPIMDPSMHLLTKYGKMTLIDKSQPRVVDAVTTLSAMVHSYNNTKRTIQMEKNLLKFYQLWNMYPETIESVKMVAKNGAIRKTIVSGRVHCSFRTVITPIVRPYYSDELHLPWSVGVSVLRLEIINLLCSRYGKTRKQAMEIQQLAEVEYDATVDAIIKTLIHEAPFKGLPAIFGRNPTIRHGAMQLFFVTMVKTDTADFTTSVHPLVLAAPNAKSLASSAVMLL